MKCTCGGELVAIEIQGWYDGVAFRDCRKCQKSFSREALKPLERNELCRKGKIYQVEQTGEYQYKVLGERED